MDKPTHIDEQSRVIMQGILDEANYHGRHYIGKHNNEQNRTAMQYQIAQMLHRMSEERRVMPIAMDDEGRVYDFDGLQVVENPHDATKVDVETIWKKRREWDTPPPNTGTTRL